MFNLSGSEIVVILLLALVVLGPEKLPDAVRRAGKAYAEFRKMSTTFQREMREAMDEPMREVRETADLIRKSTTFDADAPGAAAEADPTGVARPADVPESAPPASESVSGEPDTAAPPTPEGGSSGRSSTDQADA